MLPSYSVRRGRLTAQLPCRTGTSYTPVMHAHQIFYLIYSLFTIIYSLIQRTLPYSIILWAVHASDWQLVNCVDRLAMIKPTTSASISPKATTQATTQAQRTSASFAPSASLPLRTSSPHTRDSQYTLILRNHLGAPARATPGRSEIIESRTPHAQHLATTQAITRAQRTPASFALSASLPFALLATTLT